MPPEPHRRRSAEQSTTLLVNAARDLFRQKGFARTTTREIARHADVPERVLFRHFPTKAILFEAVVAEPLVGFIEAFNDQWRSRQLGGQTAQDLLDELLVTLMALLRDNRTMFLDLAALRSSSYPSLGDGEVARQQLFGALFEILLDLAVREGRTFGLRPESLAVDVRMCFGLVLSVALFGDDLFTGVEPRMDDAQLRRHVIRFVLGSMGVAPDARLEQPSFGDDELPAAAASAAP